MTIRVHTKEPVQFTLAIRIPGWCRDPSLRVNGDEMDLASLLEKGYAKIKRKWRNGEKIQLSLPMPVERVRAHPEVRATVGKVALMRGPIVYCLEEVDNGPNLAQIVLPSDAELVVEGKDPILGDAVTLRGMATKVDASAWGDELYAPIPYNSKTVPIRAIPYYAWANRTPGEMTVWIREG